MKKRLGSGRGVRLYRQDEETLMRQIKTGKYQDMSEAIREAISTHLTSIRLKEYRGDYSDIAIKSAQKEIVIELEKKVDKVDLGQADILNKIDELRAGLKMVIDNQSVQKSEQPNQEFENLQASLNKVISLLHKSNAVAFETRTRQYLIQGLLTFFAVGFHAGKINPIKSMEEKKFVKLLDEATKKTLKEANESLENDPSAKLEEIFVIKFAQDIFNRLYSLD